MDRFTIGKTKSLSPLSFEEVDADIICEDGKVFLEKRDEEGKLYKSLIETNLDFYKFITQDKVPTQLPPRQIFFYTSLKCNLKCPICYEELDVKDEITIDEIKEVLKDHRNKGFTLTGRESTCRDDIFEIIKVVSENNRALLLTNGLKLADYDYTVKLKESGVALVIFSFNGFNDEIYRQMNGKPLLKIKLQALENLKKVGIKTCLSVTLAKGINDKELREICDFCIDNRSFIYQLRIRTLAPMGRHLENVEQHCLSEMVQLIADQLQIPMSDIMKELAFWKMFVDELEPFVPPSLEIRKLVMSRVCSLNFTIRKDLTTNRYYSLGSRIDVDAISRAKFKKPLLIYYFAKAFGIRNIAQNVIRMLRIPLSSGEANSLMVILRCWPNLYTIDLEENKKCLSVFYKDGNAKPFCYSNIMTGKLAAEKGPSQ
ncbi:MAG: radical SAM protein [Deltaproteobacteria bacterium]|nr:radical SAM protein [Deltaproteobacteria bacterium]